MTKTISPGQQVLALDEFETIETPSFVLVDGAIDKLARTPRSIAIVVGNAGVGKNFAVRRAVAKHSLPAISVTFTSQAGASTSSAPSFTSS